MGEFEITKREVVASVSIIAVLLLIGVLISSKISQHHIDKNEIYNKAIKISSKDLFEYGMKTNIGNAFVYGDLEAVDTVTYPEITGEYMSIKKVKEKYTKHTRVVTKHRNVNGHSMAYTETQTYYTWDEVEKWSEHCEKVKFLGFEFNYGEVYNPPQDRIDTQMESLHIRYVYYGSPVKYTGTLFTYLGNGTINQQCFYNGQTIDQTMERLESNAGLIFFWIFWFIFIAVCVYGFYYLDNRWLED